MKKITLFLLVMVLLPGCRQSSTPKDPANTQAAKAMAEVPPLAVTAPILAVAVRDVLEADEPVLIVGQAGNRPERLSLAKSEIQRLRGCEMLLHFDSQSSLDKKLGRISGTGPRIVTIQAPGGMCQPDSYLGICQQAGNALVERGRLSHDEVAQRAASIAVRLQQLFSWMRDEVVAADLRQVSVLASESQAAFCRQLGLNVISTFSDAKSASENPGEIDRAADIGSQAEIRFIITNRHGERQVAEALADRTGGQVIEFAAVPETNDANAFDKMVRGNVRLLLDASTGSRGGRVP